MKRVLAITALAIIVLLTGFLAYVKYIKQNVTTEAFSLIPSDAIYILEADDPIENWNEFSSSPFWNYLAQHAYFKELSGDADYLDSLVNANQFLLDHLGKRNLFMSAHMISNSDYDFFFLVDLKDAGKFQFTTKLIEAIMEGDDYTVFTEKYFGIAISSIKDKVSGEVLHLAQIDNFLALSYTKDIITNCIDEKESPSFSKSAKFTEVKDNVSQNGLARIYFQYDLLEEYMSLYYSDTQGLLKELETSFSFSGLAMSLSDNTLLMNGFTSIPDSITSYTSLLAKHGNSSVNFDKILSSRIAYAQFVGLADFNSFYNELIQLRSETDVKHYNRMVNKVEKVLGLSLEEDFLSWIGSEVVIAQNLPSKLHNNQDDLIIAIKANDIELATEKLANIQKMIKRRTPAQFRKYEYKNFPIYYLDVNNMFELFFGKAFAKLTKPYYTIIEDYVVFSNNPKTIVSTLEDYENGYTLSNSETFKSVKDEMDNKSALFTYINGELAYEVYQKNVSPKSRSAYHKNKKYIAYFKGIGIAYTADHGGFSNDIYLAFSEENILEVNPVQNMDSLFNLYYTDFSKDLANLSESESFVLSNLQNNTFIKYYKGTSVIQFKCPTKNGLLHGKANEYYLNGNLKAEGRYRKGKKSGVWKYYDTQGKVEKKKWNGL